MGSEFLQGGEQSVSRTLANKLRRDGRTGLILFYDMAVQIRL
jgi:hypothetical protein